jgi:Uma2 family endonuclease
MTAIASLLSLEDYFTYNDGTDALYELENGALRAMPPESDLNQRIASLLFAYFLQAGVLPAYLRMKTEVVVSGARTTVRVPDLMVLSPELAAALAEAERATVMLDMPPPQLVVEVVSPGQQNRNRDYRYKRSQYEARGIGEYWIVDPTMGRVSVLTRVEGLYEEAVFEGEAAIVSPFLAELKPSQVLTTTRALAASD